MPNSELHNRIKITGLRVTPQRLIVLDLLDKNKHPTADQISKQVRVNHPNISTGTIYKILDAFVEKGIITKVATKGDVMRYDSILEKHHHLVDDSSTRIEDYYDEGLFELIENYLSNKDVPGFQVSDIKIQIIGKFNK